MSPGALLGACGYAPLDTFKPRALTRGKTVVLSGLILAKSLHRQGLPGVAIEWLGTGRGGMSTDPEALADIPTADAELVDVEEERVLLAGFRNLPRRSQQLLLELVETLPRGRWPSSTRPGSSGCIRG